MLNFKRHLRDAFSYTKKHKAATALSWILMVLFAFTTMALTMVVFTAKQVNSNVEDRVRIQVYIDNNATKKQVSNLQQQILATPNVESTKYSSKKNELKKLVKQGGDAFKVDNDDGNPVSAIYYVKINNVNQLETTSKKLQKLSAVDHVVSGIKDVQQTQNFMKNIILILFGLEVIVLLINFVLLFITTKFNMKAQKVRIDNQLLVGATKNYIKAPFIYNGALSGIAGTVISILVAIPLYDRIYLQFNNGADGVFKMIPPLQLLPITFLIVLILMMGFGALTSNLSIRIKEQKY